MEIKISENTLEFLIDIIVSTIGIDKYDSFQSRVANNVMPYIEFLTPQTRRDTISRYYPTISRVVVNDDKLYDLISEWSPSHKIYDIIKDELIVRIYKIYTDRFKHMSDYDIRNIKYMDDEQFNKK